MSLFCFRVVYSYVLQLFFLLSFFKYETTEKIVGSRASEFYNKTEARNLIFILQLSGVKLIRLKAQGLEITKMHHVVWFANRGRRGQQAPSLVNEFAKVPSWVASTTSWGFCLTRCFGKLEDTLLSLISFHGYWVPLFTNKRMRGCCQKRT